VKLTQREKELIQIAIDHFGSAIRDNSVEDKISMGLAYDSGDCDCENCLPYLRKCEADFKRAQFRLIKK
jgi:hypothetical protein